MTETSLTVSQICLLTQAIAGGEYKRAASKEDAVKRFLKVAGDRGITDAETILAKTDFTIAKDALEALTREPDVDEDEGIPGFLRRDFPTKETPKMNAPQEPASAEDKAIEAGFTAFLADDKRGDDFIREILRAAFRAGAASAVAEKPARAGKAQAERKPRESAIGSKKEIVRGLLTRPEGCTAAEILEATGWPSVSVPQQAKACGLNLRSEKDGRALRYYGTPTV